MKIYHGGTNIIERPIAAAGRQRLDFGKGFYVTDIKTQAESWAERMQRIRQEQGIVNVYELDMDRVKSNSATSVFFTMTTTGFNSLLPTVWDGQILSSTML